MGDIRLGKNDRVRKQKIAASLEEPVKEANNLAEKLGMEPFDVNYWIVDYDEMNELIAYGGFTSRYPHWRWGMTYDQQKKKSQHLGGKAFEIVNNDDPSSAFLQESNSMADQKAVITHVEAHSDFFANNNWFRMYRDDPDAAAMLERHGRRIERFMDDPDVDAEEVEKWIDNINCLENNIDQHTAYGKKTLDNADETYETTIQELEETLDRMGFSEEVRQDVFDDEWMESQHDSESGITHPEPDILLFLQENGERYNPDTGKSEEFEPWQQETLDMLREEAYYFAPQKMTKVMNEGWAAYWESLMMTGEGFADPDEIIQYADHMAQVLNSPGLNPYKLGLELWQYVENRENRQEVAEHLLRIDGITPDNFHDEIDFGYVLEELEPHPALNRIAPDTLEELKELPDTYINEEALKTLQDGDIEKYPWKTLEYEGLAERHYSLVKPQHRGFLTRIGTEELDQIYRSIFETDAYKDIDEALENVDRTAGWDRMFEVRENKNDVTFIDQYLTQEFVDEHNYFAYEYFHQTGQFHTTSHDVEDVKKKLLLNFTNFGKPTIKVHDGNHNNRNELLMAHHYNGVPLHIPKTKQTMERVYELWGRPVNLVTITKEYDPQDVEDARRQRSEPEPMEVEKLFRYDGEGFEEKDLTPDELSDMFGDSAERIYADDVDYDTKPDELV